MAVIEISNLVKNYGAIEALKGVNLQVEGGEIFGLLGQNGAGKTTLVKVLLGVIAATEGETRLLQQRAGAAAVRRQVGYLPEDHQFPDYHTGYSLLDFYGMLLGMPGKDRRRRIPEMLALVGLKGRMHYKLRTYSKGMKQRVGIAQAILHDPAVVFLDEPTDGVDPLGRREIRTILMQLKEAKKTIFLNSHLLSEVELICDRVAILHQGEVVREGRLSALTRRQGTYLLGLEDGDSFPADDVKQLGFLVRPDGPLWEVQQADGRTIDPVVDLLRARGLRIRHLVEKRQTLEDLFMETVLTAEAGN